jgi:hypothetical protein
MIESRSRSRSVDARNLSAMPAAVPVTPALPAPPAPAAPEASGKLRTG